jgi:hypothetical protein
MGPIEFTCPTFGQLKVIGDRLHDGHDFVIEANTANEVFDYLVFFDSRGISRQFDNSLADKLISKIVSMGKSYLLVCRPLELTIWATLIGFLSINRLNPAKIITNMGFVDFTPKKQSILQDAVLQVELAVGKNVAASFFVEDYLSSGREQLMPLYSMQYGKDYRLAIEAIAAQQPLVIINTPLTDTGIAIEKRRPSAFFPAQAESNEFNRSINGAQVIDLPNFDETLTYDAVHYTSLGNEVIFERLKGFL